jgi:hypothetical protein
MECPGFRIRSGRVREGTPYIERSRTMRMRSGRALAGLIGFAAMVTAPSGCGSGGPYNESSTEEATVKGTVKVHGKLVDGGVLHFNGFNAKRQVLARDAPVGKDGKYTAQAYIGVNTVTLTPPKPRNKAQGREFFGLEYDERTVNVQSGENTADLEFLP